MRRVLLRGLWARKRRLVATVAAVALGVAFLGGTLVLGDTVRAGFDGAFTEANAGTDAVVRGRGSLATEAGVERGFVPLALVDRLRGVDGVAAVEPVVEGQGQLVDADGDPVGGDGPPTVAGSWITDPGINPYELAEGRPPAGPGEVVVNRGAAEQADLALGDATVVLTPDPVPVIIVGIATFGGTDGIGPTTYAAFTFDEAARLLLPRDGVATRVLVAADAGVGQDELAQRIAPLLGDDLEVLTGEALTAEQNADIERDFIGFFETLLLVFAGISLVVATFSIYNTFAITIAQRTRESALLRALGASRRQIAGGVAAEAVVVGLLGGALGAATGAALATGLWELAGMGTGGGVELGVRSLGTAVAIGLVVTVVASVAPAVRSSRVAPLAALREVAVDAGHASRPRVVAGAILLAAGGAALVGGALAEEPSLPTVGVGALATVLAVVVLGPVLAHPVARLLGAPMARRIPGRLARGNAMRNPRRTAATSLALTIGVAIVAMYTVFAATAKVAIADTVAEGFSGDLVIQSTNFSGAGLSPDLAVELDALPEVDAVGYGFGPLLLDGVQETPMIGDPAALGAMIDVEEREGSLAGLRDDQLAVSDERAAAEGWTLGTPVPVAFADGTATTFTIGAVYEEHELVDDVILPVAAWTPHATNHFDTIVFLRAAEGVEVAEARAAATEVTRRYHAPEPQTEDEYVDTQNAFLDQTLTVVYVLLALSGFIALMGIANTLSLAVHERTSELGLLRAVGQTRRQLRSMVRRESVLLALHGTIVGLALGVGVGWAFLRAAADSEGITAPFTVPVTGLAVILLIGGIVGVLAGERPARRAAKLDVLEAIASE